MKELSATKTVTPDRPDNFNAWIEWMAKKRKVFISSLYPHISYPPDEKSKTNLPASK